MESRTPASVLIQPSRPTTATTSSPPPHFLSPLTTTDSPAYTPPLEPPRQPGPIPNLLPLFAKYPVGRSLRGTVRIRVEETVFFCHREVLILASPFFEACIMGGWKESEPRKRKVRKSLEVPAAVRVGEDDAGSDPASPSSKRESFQTSKSNTSVDSTTSVDEGPLDEATESTDRSTVSARPSTPIIHSPQASEAGDVAPSFTASYMSSVVEDDDDDDTEGEEDVICRLSLPEESAAHFQDLLCFLYPRQECLISWNNAAELCRMASKFDIPSLRNACIAFLLPSAAGKPLAALKIAEEMGIPELYKEASRYALDNYSNWQSEDLATLSQTTLLKLERRRSWFLERLLKLGLVQTSRDYVCQPTCPDQSLCARLVDEKWRSAWSSAFRFGTPQPSIIYRSLRNLEPSLSSPALHLPHTACQSHARLYVADLFDRMFGIGIQSARSWGALTLNGLNGGGGFGRTFGAGQDGIAKNSARYFLSIDMKDPVP